MLLNRSGIITHHNMFFSPSKLLSTIITSRKVSGLNIYVNSNLQKLLPATFNRDSTVEKNRICERLNINLTDPKNDFHDLVGIIDRKERDDDSRIFVGMASRSSTSKYNADLVKKIISAQFIYFGEDQFLDSYAELMEFEKSLEAIDFEKIIADHTVTPSFPLSLVKQGDTVPSEDTEFVFNILNYHKEYYYLSMFKCKLNADRLFDVDHNFYMFHQLGSEKTEN